MDTFRWGIISTGYIANLFATGLQSAQNAELFAVASRSQDSANAFAEKYDIPRAYDSYQALANDPDIDIIYIGTPHVFHAENIRMCLEAGKHVLCEKPFTLNAKEAQECIALAREKNLFLMEAVWMRFIPAILETQKIVNEGIIGDILLIQADFSFYIPFQAKHRLFDLELGGGSLLDVGIYPISFATMLLGMPETVSSHAVIASSGADEQCTILFGYPKASALLSAGITGNMDNRAFIKGTKGSITIHEPFWVPDKITIQIYGEDAETREIPYIGNGYNYEADAAQNMIHAGKIEHKNISHDETIATMQLMDALRQEWQVIYPQEE